MFKANEIYEGKHKHVFEKSRYILTCSRIFIVLYSGLTAFFIVLRPLYLSVQQERTLIKLKPNYTSRTIEATKYVSTLFLLL